MKVNGYTIEPKANLSWTDLSGANLFRADLSRANLSWANLSRANLSDANLSDANLSRADLSGANLSEANLSGATLPNSLIFFGYSPQGYSRFVFIEPQGLRIVMGCRTFSSFDEARQHFTDPLYDGGSKDKVAETLAAIAYAETVTKLRTEK